MNTAREKHRPAIRPVMWITGVSGVGKTTLAKAIAEKLRELGEAVVQVDGDMVREICGNEFGFDNQARLLNAQRIARFCKALNDQNLIVVCSTISFFESVRAWNRVSFRSYIEVHLTADHKEIARRNSKGLYDQAGGAVDDCIVGVNQILEEPRTPHLRLVNETDADFTRNIDEILSFYHGRSLGRE